MARYTDGTEVKVGDLVTLSGPATVGWVGRSNLGASMVLARIDGCGTWVSSASLRRVEPPTPPTPKRPKLPAGWRYVSDERQPLPRYGPLAYVPRRREQDAEITHSIYLNCYGHGVMCDFAGGLRWLVEFVPKRPKLPEHPGGEYRYVSDERQPLPKYGPVMYVAPNREENAEISEDGLIWYAPGELRGHADDLRWIVEFVPEKTK